MATYLQGQQDYVTQIQPTQPNLQFDAQMLGNLQNKYDAGHKKVSELYGSLLNAGMTRTDNIEARNEFFKMINEDIRRMGSLDFSLQQNVDAAANVFQSIYTNKGIVKDMVWTRNYQNQMNKRNSLKNCTDPEKCGGSVWDIGDRAMAYRREAFQNATAEEALGMSNVEYVPQQNMMKDAIKLAKAADLNVTIDKITGKYKVTTKNGDLITSPLTLLFKETFARDPKYKDMYATKAYVSREDWQHNGVKEGKFKDLDEAKVGYLQDIQNKQNETLKKNYAMLQTDEGYLDKKIERLKKEYNAGKFTQNSKKGRYLSDLISLKQSATGAKQYTQDLINAQNSTNPDAAYDVLAAQIDARKAYSYMNDDITNAVRVMAFRDKEITKTPDEFAKLSQQHINKLSEIKAKHTLDMKKVKFQEEMRNWRESIKAEAKAGKQLKGLAASFQRERDYVDKVERSYDAKAIELQGIEKAKRSAGFTGAGTPTLKQITSNPKSKKVYDAEVARLYKGKAKAQFDANIEPFKEDRSDGISGIRYPNSVTVGMLKNFGDKTYSDGRTLVEHYHEYIKNRFSLSDAEASKKMNKLIKEKSGDDNAYVIELPKEF